MDFIERIFGISPDNNSGWLEVWLFLLPLVLFAAAKLRKHGTNRARHDTRGTG